MDNTAPHDFRQKIFARLPELETLGEVRIPNQRFWDFYHANKELFYHACLYPRRREDGVWVLVAYEFVDRVAQHREKVEAMAQRHCRNCPTCDVPPLICVSTMSDGRKQFKLYCPSCYGIYGGALPYLLVEHLENEGVHICVRELVYQNRSILEESEREL